MNISSNRARSPRFRSLLDHAHLRHYLLKAGCLVAVGCCCVYTQRKCILFRQTITNYMDDCFKFFFVLWCSSNQIGWLTVVQTIQAYIGIVLLLQKPSVEAMGKEYRKYGELPFSITFWNCSIFPWNGKNRYVEFSKAWSRYKQPNSVATEILLVVPVALSIQKLVQNLSFKSSRELMHLFW